MGQKHIIPEPPRWYRSTMRMLEELPDVAGAVLWQYARHLRDWVSADAVERARLFPPRLAGYVAEKHAEAAREHPELADAFDRFRGVVAAPLAPDQADIAAACRSVSEWAESGGHVSIAVEFAEIAALLEHGSPGAANRAARLNRNAAEFERAEVWFERAIGLARQSGDRVEYTRGHIGYGILCQTLGRSRRARKHFQAAAFLARKDGRHWLAAEAQHDLMLMSTEQGNYHEAELHAAKAVEWYPKHHPRFPFFAADFAFLLICQAHYTSAVELLDGFLKVVDVPALQVLAMSTLARALAGAGDRYRFAGTRRRARLLLEKYTEYEPTARINLAEAERTVGLWSDAEANARAALELAQERRQAVPERLARVLLEQIRHRSPAPTEAAPAGSSELVAKVSSRLLRWSPTRRGRVPSLGRGEWAA